MSYRDWLNRFSSNYDRITGKGGSWPWIAALAVVAFLFLVASTGSLSAVAELVRALAALCWPALVYVVLRTYQEEIRGLLHRIRRAKPAPAELELRAELDELEQQVRAEPASLPARSVAVPGEESERNERRIMDAAALSPRLGLMELSLAIEQELHRLLAAADGDVPSGPDGRSVRGLAERLVEIGPMPQPLARSVIALAELRHRLVHAHANHDNEAMRAIDLGTTVLRCLRTLTVEANSDAIRTPLR